MFASIVIGFVGSLLTLFFLILFVLGLVAVIYVALTGDEEFLISNGGWMRFFFFVCGPVTMVAAAFTRALI